MMSRRLAIVAVSSMSMLDALAPAWAEDVRVMESTPAARAVIGGRSSDFLVRFDRQVDHIQSIISIRLSTSCATASWSNGSSRG